MPPLLRGKKRSRAESALSPGLLQGKKRGRADFSRSPGLHLQLDDDDVMVLEDAAAGRAWLPMKSRDVDVMDSNMDSFPVLHVPRVSEAADSDVDEEYGKAKKAEDLKEELVWLICPHL